MLATGAGSGLAAFAAAAASSSFHNGAYSDEVQPEELELVEQETLLQLGPLMLTRVGRRSKVEYLVGEEAVTMRVGSGGGCSAIDPRRSTMRSVYVGSPFCLPK